MWDLQVKKAKEAGFMPADVDTDYDTVKKDYNPDHYKIEVPNVENIRTEMETFDHILPLLFERRWVLAKAPEGSPGFITSDHPVCLFWSEPNPARGNRGPGLKHKGSEILFPVSPSLAVIGAYELENGEADLTEEEVAASNGTIAVFAQRQVYAPTMDFKYQIDHSQPPKGAALLIDDDRFKPAN